jgi:hypothetical protein
MVGDESVYCSVSINKVGGEAVDQETSTRRRRLVDLQEVEFSVVDLSGRNGAMIEKNIVQAATSNDGGGNALLANLQQEAYNEGLLTEDLARMTASQMGTPTVEQTAVTTYEDEEYSAAAATAASQESDSSTSTGESSNSTTPTAAIAGGAGGLVLVIGLILLLSRRSSENRERLCRPPTDVLDDLGSQKKRMQGGNCAEEAPSGYGESVGGMDDSNYSHAAASMSRTKSVAAAVDPNSGETYYHNTVTNKTAWTADEASRKWSTTAAHISESVGVRVTEVEDDVFHNPMFVKKSMQGMTKTVSKSSVF